MTYSQYFRLDTRDKDQPREEPDFKSLVKKEPEYKCEHPFRNVARLGTGHFIFVFDATNFETDNYDLLYFDKNGNGDLTDDPIIKAEPKTRYSRRGVPPRRHHHPHRRRESRLRLFHQRLRPP